MTSAENDPSGAYAEARDTRTSPEYAETGEGSNGRTQADAGSHPYDGAADRFAPPDPFGRADAPDPTGTTEGADAAWSDIGTDIGDGDAAQIDIGTFGAAPDKRSWGIGPGRPGTPPPASQPSSLRGTLSAKSLVALDGTARRPTRGRSTAGVGGTTAQRLHDPADAAVDPASRTEALSALVTQLLATHAPSDRPAPAKDAGVETDAFHGDPHAPISIRVDHVFPETLLTLTISEPAISLRFQSRSAESRALLSDQRNALASRVTTRTGRATHIEIVA
jgi:hypothetical protein